MDPVDIIFEESDSQNFVFEIPRGILNAPVDILAETDGNLICSEVPIVDSIFINLD